MASVLIPMKKKKTTRVKRSADVVVVKPIWWRQFFFSLFIFVLSFYFAFVSKFGELTSWVLFLVSASIALLNFIDQLCSWSSLRIDKDGYFLRTWWRKKKFAHYEIKDFDTREYAGRKLIVVRLKENFVEKIGQGEEIIPFPCTFGRPVEEVLAKLKNNLDKSPKPLNEN